MLSLTYKEDDVVVAKQREGYASAGSQPLVRTISRLKGGLPCGPQRAAALGRGVRPAYSRSNRTGGCSSIVSSKSGPASQRNKRRIHSRTITVRLLNPAESRASPLSQ